MTVEKLDALLERMPRIAEAINQFSSEAVQQEAFSALMETFLGGAREVAGRQHEVINDRPTDTNGDPEVEPSTSSKAGRKKNRSKPRGPEWSTVRGLDLHPTGKQSFESFVEEKQPRSNEDRYAVIVYYLEQLAEIPNITINHIGTVFRLIRWPEPTALRTGVQTAATRKGTIDTSDMEAIATTPAGRNFVEHKLPLKVKPK